MLGLIHDLPTLRKKPEHLQTLNATLTKGHRESADKSDRLQEAWSEKRGDLYGRRKLTRQGPFLQRDRRAMGEFQPHSERDGERRPVGDPILGYFPPVVSEELFYKVQAELSRRHTGAHPGKKRRVLNIFVGLTRCSFGRAMEFRDKCGRKYRSERAVYLICSGAQEALRAFEADLEQDGIESYLDDAPTTCPMCRANLR